MNIIISNSDKNPIYEQIRSQIRDKILSKELAEGDPLPSMRSLAKDLRIIVITTKRAYDELEKDGFISTVQGRGTFVSSGNIEIIKEEYLKNIEESFREAIKLSDYVGLDLDELKLILETIYREG